MVFEPGHPDADENGYVAYPDSTWWRSGQHDHHHAQLRGQRGLHLHTKTMFNKALEIGK
jgi:flagellar basal body rod protein FlgC